jgi:hypothetical protein
MSQNLYVARCPAVAARKLGMEMTIMSGGDSTLFALDEAATIIWKSASGAVTLSEIAGVKVCAAYEVELAGAIQNAETIAEGLAQHGLLLISREPILDSNTAGGSAK